MDESPPIRTGTGVETPHAFPADEVLSRLGTGPRGLSQDEAGARLEIFGANRLPAGARVSRLKLLLGQFKSVLIIVLLAAAGINLAVWYLDRETALPYDTFVIMAIVVANAAIGFFQEHQAERSLERLKELSSPGATVIRDGARRRLAAHRLVPGDVMVLARGDRVAADGRLFEAGNLQAGEGALTGESETIMKSVEPLADATPLADRTNMVYAGTAIMEGRGLAVVTATGCGTEMGKIAELIQSVPSRETPLKKDLDRLGRQLSLIILAGAAGVSAVAIAVSGHTDTENILSLLLFGVALAVAAIPEGLPAVVTGALALGTQRIAHRKAIIRRLPAVETLGSTTAICSDKTGTLTMGEMTVRELFLWPGTVEVGGAGYQPEGAVEGEARALDAAVVMAMSAVLCNDAALRETAEGRWFPVGTPTEAALVTMAAKLGIEASHLREQNRRLAEEPFTSHRKQMSVVVSSGGGGAVLHTKGAPELVIPACTAALGADGRTVSIGEDDRRRLSAAAGDMATRQLRPLAVASRQLAPGECGVPAGGAGGAAGGAGGPAGGAGGPVGGAGGSAGGAGGAATGGADVIGGTGGADDIASCERDLVFLGIAGIYDPPRPEAAASIDLCRRAGIDVFMITGDHIETAQAIARELGIGSKAVTGADIDHADDRQLSALLDDTRVFARVSPGHKVRIVDALRDKGETVAVTGDGVNDAPALKTADIGVAMGRSGTDVAREAADMVLLDDNFATIVAAVEEGRGIFANIRKFLGFLLSSNSGLALTLFLAVIFSSPLGLEEEGRLLLPLLAVQILWINLVTNGPPALALGVDPRDPNAMLAPPRPRTEQVVNGQMLRLVMLVGLVSGIGGLLLLAAYVPGGGLSLASGHDIAYARTMAFVALTFFQLFDSLNFRDFKASVLGRRLYGNRWLLAALALSTLMMVAVVELPPLQTAFHTRGLSPVDWLIAVAVASSVVWAVELFKLAARLASRSADRIPLR